MEGSKNQKTKINSIKLQLMKDEFNALFSILDAFIKADPESTYGTFASYMQSKIMKYGREYTRNNEQHIELILFQNEVSKLINLFIVFESVFHKPKENYYEKFHQNKNIYN